MTGAATSAAAAAASAAPLTVCYYAAGDQHMIRSELPLYRMAATEAETHTLADELAEDDHEMDYAEPALGESDTPKILTLSGNTGGLGGSLGSSSSSSSSGGGGSGSSSAITVREELMHGRNGRLPYADATLTNFHYSTEDCHKFVVFTGSGHIRLRQTEQPLGAINGLQFRYGVSSGVHNVRQRDRQRKRDRQQRQQRQNRATTGVNRLFVHSPSLSPSSSSSSPSLCSSRLASPFSSPSSSLPPASSLASPLSASSSGSVCHSVRNTPLSARSLGGHLIGGRGSSNNSHSNSHSNSSHRSNSHTSGSNTFSSGVASGARDESAHLTGTGESSGARELLSRPTPKIRKNTPVKRKRSQLLDHC
jgi:hypothetical protein